MRKLILFLLCLCVTIGGISAHAETDDGGAAGEAGAIEVNGEPVEDASGDATEAPAVPSPSPTPVPTAAPVINADFDIDVQLGYDGLLIMGRQSPALVTVTNNGAQDFDGMLGVNAFTSQTAYDRYEIPLTLAAGATKQARLPFTPKMRQDMFAFELTQGATIIAEKRIVPARMLSAETLAVGILSENATALDYIAQRANGADTMRGEAWMPIALDSASFPDSAALMSSFSLLVVDGIDMRALTQAQQDALTDWLIGGGHVFLSGGAKAAAGYPFFTQWTGIEPGKPAAGGDVTAQLLSYMQAKGEATGESVWLTELPADGALITADEGGGLLHRAHVGSGAIYTAAFDLGDKALASWPQMTSLLPRVLRQSASDDYLRMLNRIDELMYSSGNDYYSTQSMLSRMTLANNENGALIWILLAAYLVIAGFGAYFLLKRLDRREWLWAAVPAAALVFSLVLWLISSGSEMNKPVILSAARITLEGDTAQTTTYLAVSTADSGELLVQTDQQTLPEVLSSDYNYFYDDYSNGERLFRPQQMRQRYRLGAAPAVGFASVDPWDAKYLRLPGVEQDIGDGLSVELWMQSDGIHGTAVNQTGHTLSDCLVVTNFGFSTVGDLLPGQSASFAMLYPDEPFDAQRMQQGDIDDRPKANTLYLTLDMDMSSVQATGGNYYDLSIYQFLDAAMFPTQDRQNDADTMQRYKLVQMFESSWNLYSSRQEFFFFGFSDTLGQVTATLNGERVDRTAHLAAVGMRARFEPIGPTGQVLFPQGYIRAEVVVDEGEDKKPRLPTGEDTAPNGGGGSNSYGSANDYIMLSSPVALRFLLPEHERYDITRMTLVGTTYGVIPEMYLYNNDTRQWDRQTLLTISRDGDAWAPYIDRDGAVFARIVPGDSGGRYDDMPLPTISLRGEVK